MTRPFNENGPPPAGGPPPPPPAPSRATTGTRPVEAFTTDRPAARDAVQEALAMLTAFAHNGADGDAESLEISQHIGTLRDALTKTPGAEVGAQSSVTVPAEPTTDMLTAGALAKYETGLPDRIVQHCPVDVVPEVYRAMLAAAPAADVGTGWRDVVSVKWNVRGVGRAGGCPDLRTGEHVDYSPDMSGFVSSRAEGALAVAIFGGHAYLDYRPSEPSWIQVKVCCDEETLRRLEKLVRDNDNILTPAIVETALAPASDKVGETT